MGADDAAAAQPEPGAVWCILVAAGSGRRFGGAKQFRRLAGRRVVDLAAATASACCDGVVVVMPPGSQEPLPPGVLGAVGGETRSASVRAGLAEVPDAAQVVLVHDAARPLASAALFGRVVAAVRAGAAAAVPVVEVVDSVRRVGAGPLDRSDLRAVQTPQGFDAAVLRRAHADGGEATDDAALVEDVGGVVELVEGERENLKLTEAVDLVVAEALLAHRDAAGGDSSA
jgi:2-C-methyl-D-erythritol 4-phosphate cytidylyltransferase